MRTFEHRQTPLTCLTVSVFRHCGAVELGRAMITLKEAKQTVEDPVKFSSHCPLVQTKRVSFQSVRCDAYHLIILQECGEILFGLSYLPTAQRLSFSLVKVTGIKAEKSVEEPISES